MPITRIPGVFLGVDETTGVTIATGGTTSGPEVDVLGDMTSAGELRLYVSFTGAGTAGFLNLRLNARRVSGQAYAQTNYPISVAPIAGTQKVPLGVYRAARYMQVDAFNNGTGGNLTNVTVGYELVKFS
jgi:hypothetical protein